MSKTGSNNYLSFFAIIKQGSQIIKVNGVFYFLPLIVMEHRTCWTVNAHVIVTAKSSTVKDSINNRLFRPVLKGSYTKNMNK